MKKLEYVYSFENQVNNKLTPLAICEISAIGVADIN